MGDRWKPSAAVVKLRTAVQCSEVQFRTASPAATSTSKLFRKQRSILNRNTHTHSISLAFPPFSRIDDRGISLSRKGGRGDSALYTVYLVLAPFLFLFCNAHSLMIALQRLNKTQSSSSSSFYLLIFATRRNKGTNERTNQRTEKIYI